jgi:hypothetical protein
VAFSANDADVGNNDADVGNKDPLFELPSAIASSASPKHKVSIKP